MKIIIDTHIFLWAIAAPEKLSKQYAEELETLSNTVYVSSITMVEIMIKNTIGKLAVDVDLVKAVQDSGFELLDFTAQDALALKNMPLHHKDPFDRMLIAQAINNNYYLMSDDSKFVSYNCRLL